jgi:type I restriction enzyme, S subunit
MSSRKKLRSSTLLSPPTLRRLGIVSEWRETTLGDLVDFVSGGTPSKDNAAYWNGAIPWVSAKDMKRLFLDDAEDHITESGLSNGTRLAPAKTVLLLTRGMTLLNDIPICVARRPMAFNQDVKALRPKGQITESFIPYLLLGNKSRLLSLVDLAGHGTGRLNTDELKSLEVQLPPENEQRAIAHILGTLDDKIELNRRMNETLEAMARALFKSWFIDFDPVRRNIARRSGQNQPSPNAPRHPLPLGEGQGEGGIEHLDALFPDSFEDSELGEIPKGWEVGPLRDFTSYISRGIGPAYVEHGGISVLNQKCIRNRRVDLSKARRHNSTKKPIEGRMLRKFDVLVNSTGVGTLGRVAQVFELPEEMIVDSHVTVVRASENVHPLFLGVTLIQREGDIEALGEGSTGQTELSRTRLGILEIIKPPTAVQKAFGQIVEPVVLRNAACERESARLAALRDTLLPKLLRGELSTDNVKVI